MQTRNTVLNSLVILGFATAGMPLYSTTLDFSSRATWLAAVSGVTTTTFDVSAPGFTPPAAGGPDYIVPSGGLTLNGVNFDAFYSTNTERPSYVVKAGPNSQYYNWGTGGAIYKTDLYQGSLARIHVSLPGLVTAWSTDLMTGNTPGGIVNIQVNGNPVCPSANCQAPTFSFPNAAFFGMTSDTGFTSLDLFFPVNTYLAIDNFSIATANTQTPDAETPEVCTFLLCASGLIGLSKAKKLRFLLAA